VVHAALPHFCRAGFTLLELIVVLVIISLMSALVVPRLMGPMSALDLKTASKKIAASLRYARSRATSEKITCLALFDFDKNRVVIVTPPDGKGDFSMDNQEEIDKMLEEQTDKNSQGWLNTYRLPDGIRLEKGLSRDREVQSGVFRVFFSSSGGSSGGEITVAGKEGRHYKITVDAITGLVKLSGVAGS
jgi:general secretion pathway protein H